MGYGGLSGGDGIRVNHVSTTAVAQAAADPSGRMQQDKNKRLHLRPLSRICTQYPRPGPDNVYPTRPQITQGARCPSALIFYYVPR